ncbi:hypothetical protein [Algibacter sp. PT7-4]|uniref:hypothetical protein n=1 Tax=Algibacter ulvanivorans TaxID=3400999 RepID=UPI003AB0346D
MRYCFVFLFIFTLASCEYFNVKKTSSEAILKEELKAFNWNDVDEYPSFAECDSVKTKQNRTQCFQHIITQTVRDYLLDEQIVVTQDISDTLNLKFRVTNKGDLVLLDVKINALTVQEIPDIKQFIDSSLLALPKIYPAIKRGQQVTTEFKLPIVIQVN